MKTKLPLLLGTLFLAGAVHAQTANSSDVEQWQRYTVAGEEFSVKLPVRPVLTALQVSNPQGQGKRWERTLMATSDGVHFWVYAYENPKPRQPLDDFIREQTRHQRLKLVDKQTFEEDGIKRHEYRWTGQNRPRTEQYIATEQHLYRFLVDGANAEDPRAKAFFSSILLGKNPEGVAVDPSPQGEPIYTAKDVDQKARITRFFPPDYTEEARRNKVTGIVILKVVLSSNGQITNISVVSGLPFGLTERAIAAARKLQFVPAVKDGKNVSMWTQVEYNFNLY
jgi:TonB family protein